MWSALSGHAILWCQFSRVEFNTYLAEAVAGVKKKGIIDAQYSQLVCPKQGEVCCLATGSSLSVRKRKQEDASLRLTLTSNRMLPIPCTSFVLLNDIDVVSQYAARPLGATAPLTTESYS